MFNCTIASEKKTNPLGREYIEVTISGADGSGKATLARMVAAHYFERGQASVTTTDGDMCDMPSPYPPVVINLVTAPGAWTPTPDKDPYKAGPCPLCGEFAVAAERRMDGNVACRNGHWRPRKYVGFDPAQPGADHSVQMPRPT